MKSLRGKRRLLPLVAFFSWAAHLPVCAQSGPAPTAATTIIQYNLDSTNGTTLIDAANPNLDGDNSGTLTGTNFSWVAGQSGFGNALQLTPIFSNGVITNNSIATASFNSAGAAYATASMSAWVNPAGVTGGGGSYVMGLTGSGGSSFLRFDGSTNEIVRTGYIVDGAWREVAYALPGGFAGEWNHVEGTYDNGTVALYVNGVKVGENTEKAGFGLMRGRNSLVVGVTPWDNSYQPSAYSGLIDDMRLTGSAAAWWTADGSTLGGSGTWTTDGSNWSVSDTSIAGGTLGSTMTAVFAGTSGTTVTVSSNVQVNGIQFTTNGYTLSGGTITMAGSSALDNRLTASASVGATINSVLAGTNAVAKAGAGTITLGGSNTLSGALSVEAGELKLDAASGGAANAVASLGVASGATLLVAQSNQVNDAAAVTLSGGTISRGGGVSEVFGNLNLTTGSFLDFGTGATGHLTFGTYQNNATPSALLTLNNFLPGNSFTFSSTSFTTNSVGSYFAFGTGYVGSSITNTGSTFTITAIPEPSTYLAAAGLLAVLLWPAGRRMAAGGGREPGRAVRREIRKIRQNFF